MKDSWKILGGMKVLWRKEMQQSNKKEFMGVPEKVQEIRRELLDKQRSMETCPIPQDSTAEEKSLNEILAKSSMIEESIYK